MVRWFGLAAVALVAGCAPGSCDPSQAGFISGIGCETSGAYAQRSQSLQAQLSASHSAALQERAASIQAQQDATDSQSALAESRQRLRSIDVQNAALRRRIATLRASNRVDQGRLASAQAQLDDISRRRATLAAAPNDAGTRDLQRQQENLLGVLRGMGEL